MSSSTLSQRNNAIVRGIPASYTEALAVHFGDGPTDLDLAKQQHEGYVEALRQSGVNVIQIPTDDAFPDCVFVEDMAVSLGDRCFIPYPGHETRRGEQPAIIEELEKHLELVHMTKEGMMDGGDVLRIGDVLFIGRSTRTNDVGIAQFRKFVEDDGLELRVIDIPEHVLHLTSMCSCPNNAILLLTDGTISAQAFGEISGTEVIIIPEQEVRGANVIGFGNKMIVAQGYPTVTRELQSRGYELIHIDTTQISAADASLTCCSVFFR
ncbi:MAG: dimethylarginine dimethylaminohydrolase family protein [Candidatus Poseidoniales archaeon]|jgi:dimethylargininase|tara:strand:- start:1528 stop:2325 length:798 start_codon:yes stop_codon:yes gene_type:complete